MLVLSIFRQLRVEIDKFFSHAVDILSGDNYFATVSLRPPDINAEMFASIRGRAGPRPTSL
ncbi:MAG: hypothetical protein PHF37_08205 [Phycisphaerae bacterium]|nr:hypothetical protein [Phycisphaerae bacterium]